ncbi:DUF305 domain-containing protein [Rhodococcoides kyotonense]|uniref:DUF305 domain-containing protein n=1 Tax=Rhodococcoides kyotonense TaxID=398843 RepID=A0A177YE74_9NOCA|nr:DUF305 domain-containing protein [Rhodococcus kyotonensis]OAK53833.1 DUF305 domain-containing protein [Rhodococcus kyotonensis]
MRSTKIAASVAAAAISAALIAGCSDDSSSTSMEGHSMGSSSVSATESTTAESESAQFNDADVMFAQMMYPHHAQAVEMADLVQGRTSNPDVVALAGAIAAAQQPEMDQLSAWLSEWGQPAPSTDMGSMDHSGDGSMDGMMTPQDMAVLEAASGADFDRQWLTMMIEHHTGAVDMAETEIADGSNPDAIAMARDIVETQQAEISQMQQLLG